MFASPLCFFFNDTATTEIYTLSLHDALQILSRATGRVRPGAVPVPAYPAVREGAEPSLWREPAPAGRLLPRFREQRAGRGEGDRKSTRLNSSHLVISYAVFCFKKKKTIYQYI